MAALTAAFAANARMAALGVVVYPLPALLPASYALYGHRLAEPLDWRLQLHAWCALLSDATLAIAELLAVMLWLQAVGRASWRERVWQIVEISVVAVSLKN